MKTGPSVLIPMVIRRRIMFAIGAILLVIAVGTIGFYKTEGLSFIDSLYLATQTVTTVGFGDVSPASPWGRIFAVFFMLAGAGTVLYALSTVVQSFIQSEVLSALGIRRKTREMQKLKDHYIICGAGRVGRRIIKSLENQKIPYVVIERLDHKITESVIDRNSVIIGDATSEEVLRSAGVERAKGLASCLADDADNVYVVLTARGLNEKMHIVARAVEEEAEPKLIRAGASRVIAPTIIGSQSMARALLKPAIADFMDSIVAENLDLAFDEIAIESSSNLVGKKLKDTNIRAELDMVVVAIRRKSGDMIFHPAGDIEILSGDLLLVIGRGESLHKLLEVAR